MRKLLFLTIVLLTQSLYNTVQGQACASNDSWEWPGHQNWFVAAPAGWTGLSINMNTMATTVLGAPGAGATGGEAITSYEGVSSASDDNGNLLFYTNGRRAFTGTGAAATVTFSGLLAGNEGGATGFNGSASQGIMTVKHPLTPNIYHVFTSDDANGGSIHGLNHFTFDPAGNLLSGPTRLGTFFTSEGIAVTRHANGLDLWIGILESGSGEFNAYLLTCSGIDIPNSNLNQAGAPVVSGQQLRGAIAFSWDGTRIAQAHPNGWPTADQQVSVYDFDNATGAITNPLHIAPTGVILAPYDVIFSPDNDRLYVSRNSGGIDYFDLTSGVAATIEGTRAATGISTGFSALEIGPGPILYATTGTINGAVRAITPTNGTINTATTFSAANVPGTNGNTNYGLPIMYVPPTLEPDITDVGPFCVSDPAVDLATLWECVGGDAETAAHTYSGPGITDANLGTFDPSVAGVGVHEIIFALSGACSTVDDTLFITVNPCGCPLDTSLANVINDVCVNSSVDLSVYEVTTDPGSWTIVSTPAGSNPATITGTTFDAATNVDLGTYRIRFTLNGSPLMACPDSAERNIEVVATPTINLSGGPICQGDSVQLDAGNAGATSWIWDPGNENQQQKWVSTAGPHKVVVTAANGCIDSASVTVTINTPPNVNITAPSATCDNDQAENLVATPSGGQWYINDVANGGTFDPNALGAATHEIKYSYTDGNGCSDSDSINVVINAAPTAAITPFGPLCDNGDSVAMTGNPGGGVWTINGNNDANGIFDPVLTGAGNHSVAYVATANGCSDSDTVIVVVNAAPDVSITPPTATCDNQSVENLVGTPGGGTWYINDVVNVAGTFDPNALGAATHEIKYAYTDGAGCSDSDSINVTINATPTAAITPFGPLCENEDSVAMTGNPGGGVWTINGNNDANGIFDPALTGAGNHSVAYVATANGCSDSDTVIVVVNAAPDVSITPPTVSCDNHSVETLAATPGGGTWYINDVVNVAGTFDPNALGAATHEVKYTYTDGAGCSDSDSINVTINAAPTAAITPFGPLCENAGTETMVGTPGGGTWLINGANNATGIFDPSATGAGNQEVIYQATVNGCSDTDTVTIVVNAAPTAAISSVNNGIWCANVSDTLVASPTNNVTYVWNNNIALNNDSLVINTDGTHTLVVDSTNGCSDTTTITITKDTVNAQLSDVEACDGFVATLDPGVGGSNTYVWALNGIPNGQTGSTLDVTLGPAEYGNSYGVLVVNANGCFDTASANITQKIAFSILIGEDDTICADGSVTYTVSSTGTLGNPNYQWTLGSDPTVVETSSSLSVSTEDTVIVMVTDQADNCWDSDTAIVSVNPLPVVELNDDTVFCALGKDTYTAKMTVNGNSSLQDGTYSWSPISSSTNEVVISFTPTAVIGTYTDTNGCTSSDVQNLTEHCEPTTFEIPNVFVPGGQVNPFFNPIGVDDTNYEWYVNNVIFSDFVVYNRWGLRMTQSHDLLPKWDGYFENKPVSSGTYFYVWKYKDSSLTEYSINGFIQVIQQNK